MTTNIIRELIKGMIAYDICKYNPASEEEAFFIIESIIPDELDTADFTALDFTRWARKSDEVLRDYLINKAVQNG